MTIDDLDELETIMRAAATDGPRDGPAQRRYAELRAMFMGDRLGGVLVPELVKRYHRLEDIRANLQYDSDGVVAYVIRRENIASSLRPMRDALESGASTIAQSVTGAIASLASDEISRAWAECLARLDENPDGAITMARCRGRVKMNSFPPG